MTKSPLRTSWMWTRPRGPRSVSFELCLAWRYLPCPGSNGNWWLWKTLLSVVRQLSECLTRELDDIAQHGGGVLAVPVEQQVVGGDLLLRTAQHTQAHALVVQRYGGLLTQRGGRVL